MPSIEFGVKTGQGGYTYDELSKVWSSAEELGYDSAWLYDHFYALGGDKTQPCLEAWTTLSALAAVTKRLKIGTMVTCVNYRQPSLLAKIAATVDVLSKGRLVFGIGAGWLEEEYRAYGYTFPNQSTRIRQLKEAMIVIKKLWTEDSASFRGRFYSIQNATCAPKPLQKLHPRILVGINRGKKTLPYLAAKYADGFNTTSSSFEECKAVIDSAVNWAEKLGKRDMTISWQGFVLMGGTEAELERSISQGAKKRGMTEPEFRKTAAERGFIVGLPDQCIGRLRKLRALGVNSFILGFTGGTDVAPLETFRDRVIPELR
jgi:F420-dependent oxidoreductase-like protein